METLCHQMVRMIDNYWGSVFKVCLFKHPTNTVSPTDAKLSNCLENKVLGNSPGVLVRVQLHLMLVDYCNEYEMKSMINRYLVNWIIASLWWSNMWWNTGAPVSWSTKSNSAMPYISLSVNLSTLQSLVIIYCQCGILVPTSANGIRVFGCTWTSKCDSNYMLLVYFRRTEY